MALSDKTQFDDRIAATFSTIPSKYPPLPDDVLSRFPSLESWQKEQSRVIARVREALDSMGSDFGIPLNKAQVAQELLSKTVATQYDELTARITTETTILVDENQALAQRTTTIESTINTPTTGLSARINTVETTYATKDFALAKKEEAISAAVTTSNTYTAGQITSLSSVYATPTLVETKKTEAISAAVTTSNTYTAGQITSLSSVYATPNFVETKKTEAISAAVTSANSSTDGKISALSSVYATPTFVETKKTEAISAAVTSANSSTDGKISALSSVYATPLQVTSTVNSIISASVGSTSGTIGAAIETERQARASADGNLSGKYTLKVTAGNVVTGMNITSSTGAGGDVSSVTFLASEFKIYNSATGIAPFAVIDGVVHAQNVSISGTLLVSGSIAASRLNFTPVTSTNVVASINATAEGIQISGSRIQINGSTTFSSGYNPTSKITAGGAASDVNANATTISGGKITARSISANQIQAGTITANEIFAGTITTTELNFTPVTSTNVVASINATVEGGLRIIGSKIEISGSTTFSSGYDPSTKLTPGSAAADVNANVTTINGGKITASSITADKIVTAGLSLTSSQVSGLGTLATQNTVTNSQVTGLGSLATLSTIGTSYITGLAATATNSDFSAITGTTKPANNADVTLVAINGGITITSNGLTLAGSGANAASIRSQNYVPGTSGWAIAANGDVEFASGTFRGSITGATGTFSGNLSAAGGTFSGSLVAAGGTFSGSLVAAGGTFSGALSAATGTFSGNLSAAGGTFSGALSAATGTFSGNLSAAGGTFSGSLSAATGTFSGSLVAAGGTFSGSLVAASGSFVGSVDIGSGMTRTIIDSGGLRIGSYVEWNTDGGTDTYLKFTASDPNHSNRQMVIRSGSNDPSIVIGSNLSTILQSRGFYADGNGSTIRTLTVYDSLYVTGGNLSVTYAATIGGSLSVASGATINGNTYSGSFSSNGNATFGSLTNTPFSNASIDAFSNTTFYFHPSGNNSVSGGEDGGAVGATTGAYISIRYNGRQIWIPFFTALP